MNENLKKQSVKNRKYENKKVAEISGDFRHLLHKVNYFSGTDSGVRNSLNDKKHRSQKELKK